MKHLIPLFLILLNLPLFAQQHINVLEEYKNLPNGSVMYKFTTSDSTSHVRIELPDSLKRYIIEFTEPALYAQPLKTNLKSVQFVEEKLQKIDYQHVQFENDLNQLLNPEGVGLKSQPVNRKSISQSYRKVFNGVALLASNKVIDGLKHQTYIKQIYPDNLVKAVDDGSNEALNVSDVWQKFGVTGKGVTIGIVDTGIDSTHQDLSNGKVIGGYDFINNDDNPLDDNGHGTHVAGIAAANGELKGVAPDAKLMAIKVLNQWGSGYSSNVISGIEFGIDPDGDPNTADGVDILNLSLGGEGNSNDALSIAINNAFNHGVICVVSAGNESDYYTIGSPGCAKEAITVGSVDKSKRISSFSSRGPVNNDYSVKPNILAPGNSINSTVLDNKYESMSGTSMASPHVAGAAALLKEFKPKSTAKEIRSKLIHSAEKLNYDIWTQGNGFLNISKAIGSKSSVSEAVLNMGSIENTLEVLTKRDTFYVYNNSNENLNYHLSISNNLPTQISATLIPNNFEVFPGDSQIVIMNMVIDNVDLPFPATKILSYDGTITINDGYQDIELIFSLIKSYSLEIEFDFEPVELMIIGQNFEKHFTNNVGKVFSILMPENNFDIMVQGADFYIVRENNHLTGYDKIKISRSEAKNKVAFKGYGYNGEPLNLLSQGVEMFVFNKSIGKYYRDQVGFVYGSDETYSSVSSTNTEPIVRYFSDFSNHYEFGITLLSPPSLNNEHLWYNIPFSIIGLYSSAVIENDPNEFVHLNFNYANLSEKCDSLFSLYTWRGMNMNGICSQFDYTDPNMNVKVLPTTMDFYYYPSPYFWFMPNEDFRENAYKPKANNYYYRDSLMILSSYYECFKSNNETVLRYNGRPYPYFNTEKTNLIKYNQGPLHFLIGFQDNYSGEFYFPVNNKFFGGQWNDIVQNQVKLNFYKDDILLRQETLSNDDFFNQNGSVRITYEYNQNYHFEIISSEYTIHERKGKTTAKYFFYNDINKDFDVDCPRLSNFQLLNHFMETANTFDKNSKKYIYAQLPSSRVVKFYYKNIESDEWIKIYENKQFDDSCLVQLPDNIDLGYYDIKLVASRFENDSIIHLFEPAFCIASDLELDSLALVDLYYNTHGENWTDNSNWLAGNIKDWYGVKLENNRVIEINLSNNNLDGFFGSEILQLSKLKKIQVQNNLIHSIPNLSKLANLEYTNIKSNNLTFEDIIPIRNLNNLEYSPQNPVDVPLNLAIKEGDELRFLTTLNENKCNYTWNKDSINIGCNQRVFQKQRVDLSDNGVYKCLISNPDLPALILTTEPISVNIYEETFHATNQLQRDKFSGMGVSWIDIDNDNDLDLCISNYGESNEIYQNMLNEANSSYFVNITEKAMGFDEANTWQFSFGDINNDTKPDLFLINSNEDVLYLNNGNLTFNKMANTEYLTEERNNIGVSWNDFDQDGYIDMLLPETRDYGMDNQTGTSIFINNKNLTFSRTYLKGLDNIKYVNSSISTDIDNDNDFDFIVTTSNSLIIIENDKLNFSVKNSYPINNNYYTGRTLSVEDFDNDGDLDLFVGDTDAELTGIDDRRCYIFLNDHGNYTSFLTKEDNLSQAFCRSSSCGDFDNDGDIDVIFTTDNNSVEIWMNQLQENGELKFTKQKYGIGDLAIEGAYGCALADYDNDGDLDLYVANNSLDNKLFENKINNDFSWININCKGSISNSLAIGTKINLKSTINGNSCWQMREINSQSGFCAQNSLNAEFGLGDASIIDTIQIQWPSGLTWDTTNVSVNQFINIIEPANDIPYLANFKNLTLLEDSAFIINFPIMDQFYKKLTLTLVEKPQWLNYKIDNNQFVLSGTPRNDDVGSYILKVKIDDGLMTAQVEYSIIITVENVNDAPVILNQTKLSFNEQNFIVLSLNDLIFIDVDNLNADISIIIHPGDNYFSKGDTIFLIEDFYSDREIPIQLFDGTSASKTYVITISSLNDIPRFNKEIKSIVLNEDESFEKELVIEDEKHTLLNLSCINPQSWFIIKKINNKFYISGTPLNDNVGTYYIQFNIYDGISVEPSLDTIMTEVINVNDAPVITGQYPAQFDENGQFDFSLDYLQVEDVDNEYPKDFDFFVQAGDNYQLEGNSISYINSDNGIVVVPMQVTDGFLASNTWNFTIDNATYSFEALSEQFELYPIPFTNQINLVVPSDFQVKCIEFYDLTGKGIYPKVTQSVNQYLLDFTGFPQEFILMNLVSNNNVYSRKLIRKQN